MHSALVRAQNVVGFFTTVAFFLGALTALSVLLYPANPTATVNLRNVQVYVLLLHDPAAALILAMFRC